MSKLSVQAAIRSDQPLDTGTQSSLSCSLSTASLIWVHMCLILTPGITAAGK